MEPLREKFPTWQLWVSKKIFWDLKSKIRFHSFVGLDLEYRLSTHNMVISLELKATKNQKWKKFKIPTWVPFWNNRLQVLTKLFTWKESPNFILQDPSFEFFISYVVPEIFLFFGSDTCIPDLKRTTFKLQCKLLLKTLILREARFCIHETSHFHETKFCRSQQNGVKIS